MRKLLLFLLIFSISPNLLAASKIAEVTFEEELVDTYNNVSFSNPTSVTYVPGHTGYAARSSHNADDGVSVGDFTISIPFPDNDELYISYWLKYESDYNGDCGSIWNIKWFWTGTGTYVNHTECIFQGYDNGEIELNCYQSDPGDTVTFNSSYSPYTFGDWIHVEFYWKQSTNSGANSDGIFRLTLNNEVVINKTDLVTGDIGSESVSSPAIKATCDCAEGEGWWQIDDYEMWDGLPDTADATITISDSDTTASEVGPATGSFTVSCSGDACASASVQYTLTGTAMDTTDYNDNDDGTIASFPTTVTITPEADSACEGQETVIVTLNTCTDCNITSGTETINIADASCVGGKGSGIVFNTKGSGVVFNEKGSSKVVIKN